MSEEEKKQVSEDISKLNKLIDYLDPDNKVFDKTRNSINFIKEESNNLSEDNNA